MSKLIMFSVYDKAVGAFMPPYYARSQGEALRAFSDLVNDGKSSVSAHPLDYELLRVGEFDDFDGVVVSSGPVRVVSALACLVRATDDRAGEASGGNGRVQDAGASG